MPPSASKHSAGNGPATRSPPQTTRSAPATRGSASTASSAGRLPWTSYSAATRTPAGYCADASTASDILSPEPPSRGPAQTTSSAGQPEHANGLGVGLNSPARICAIDAESAASSRGTSAAVNVVETTASGSLEEVVDDLHLLRAGAQAGDGVDGLLGRVLLLDDLGRVAPLEQVRLVVEHECAVALEPEHVEPAVDEDAVELERKRPLGPHASQPRDPGGERRAGIGARRTPRSAAARPPRRRDTSARTSSDTPPARAHGRGEIDALEQPVHGVADLGRVQAAAAPSPSAPSRAQGAGFIPATRSA